MASLLKLSVLSHQAGDRAIQTWPTTTATAAARSTRKNQSPSSVGGNFGFHMATTSTRVLREETGTADDDGCLPGLAVRPVLPGSPQKYE